MLPDRVSNPGPLTYESVCPTDCATRPGPSYRNLFIFLGGGGRRWVEGLSLAVYQSIFTNVILAPYVKSVSSRIAALYTQPRKH